MKQFNITVNGKTYQVDVEEIGSSATTSAPQPHRTASKPVSTPVKHTAAPTSSPAPAPASAKGTPASGNGIAVTSPMPGTILDIKVSVGQEVKKGDVLMILEAMKMENEIMAPESGKVISIPVAKAASVNTSELLVEIQ